jgi:hypothetical protein
VSADPIEGLYQAGERPFLVDVPASLCRAFDFFPLDNSNPFVQTLSAYASGEVDSYTGSPLERFYESWQPFSIADAQGVGGPCVGILGQPAHSAKIWPWRPGANYQYHQNRLLRREFIRVSKAARVTHQSFRGTLAFGPVSSAFAEVTFHRLTSILRSIRERGYVPASSREHIHGRLLIDGSEVRVSVLGGKHRAAALAALQFGSIPVMFGGSKQPVAIRRTDVLLWPNVINGFYTTDQALTVFDRVFSGRHPWWDPGTDWEK